jgi:hypothetical protein
MEFVHDQLVTGRKLRMLTIVDTFSRFSPALEPRFTFCGADVVKILERGGRQVRLPATIRVDQGTEFVSRDLDPAQVTCVRKAGAAAWQHLKSGVPRKAVWPGRVLSHVKASLFAQQCTEPPERSGIPPRR